MTNEQVKADIAANLPDNTSGLITPAKLRTELGTMVDYSDTAAAAAVAGHDASADAHGLALAAKPPLVHTLIDTTPDDFSAVGSAVTGTLSTGAAAGLSTRAFTTTPDFCTAYGGWFDQKVRGVQVFANYYYTGVNMFALGNSIGFDIFTDSATVEVSFISHGINDFIAVYVDDVREYHGQQTYAAEATFYAKFVHSGGARFRHWRIMWSFDLTLVSLQLPVSAVCRPPRSQVKCLWIGDSVSCGINYPQIEWQDCYPARVGRMLGIEVKNVAVGGHGYLAGTIPWPARWADVWSQKITQADIVVIQSSVNDGTLDQATVVATATALWAAIRAKYPNAVLFGMSPFGAFMGAEYIALSSALRAAWTTLFATDSRTSWIDLRLLNANNYLTFTVDGTHLNAVGAKWLSEYVAREMAGFLSVV